VAENGADAGRVYIAGFSAGGATAAIMGATYPDLYAAIGIHSGLDVGSANSNLTAWRAMRLGAPPSAPLSTKSFVPMITFHGDCDRTISAINSAQIVEAASQRSTEQLSIWTETGFSRGCRPFSRKLSYTASKHPVIEQWTVHGAGHAWSGGCGIGNFTDPLGPDASRAMLEFFLRHRLAEAPIMP
jgi:poly(3-hydroxybutyrate) depolymerase